MRREVPLRAAHALAGAEHQDRPLLDDLRRRGASSPTPTSTSTPRSSATGRSRRSRTASSWSRCPTTCASRDEVRIYEKLLQPERPAAASTSRRTRCGSPRIFAVLSRLEEPKKAGMSLLKKLKLYDGEEVEDFTTKDVRELQDEAVREGMDGISPRYVINRLSGALVRDGATCINPIDALRALRDGLEQHTAHQARGPRAPAQPDRRGPHASTTRWPRRRCRRAFVYSFEESATTLLNNYLDNVEAFCNKQKIKRPDHRGGGRAGREADALDRGADRRLRDAKKTFREEILIRISSLARRGQSFDYRSPRAAARGDREEALRRPERRGQDHDLHQDAGRRAAAPDQRGGRPAGQGAGLLPGLRQRAAQVRRHAAEPR